MHRKSADEQAKKVDVRVQLNVDTDDIPGRFFFKKLTLKTITTAGDRKQDFLPISKG